MGDWNAGWAAASVAWAAVVVLAAALVRTRRRWRAAVGERGWLLERERESAARAAVAAERDRIARELHDIVSHTVSLMVVQAGAARGCSARCRTRPRRRCVPWRTRGGAR
jgi:signal transduction histidine kinase